MMIHSAPGWAYAKTRRYNSSSKLYTFMVTQ